jgi:arylsulfatase A-like enzyme
LPAWDSLSADEKRLFARQMEVYAGFLAHTDHEVGGVLQAIEDEARPTTLWCSTSSVTTAPP